MYRQSLLAIVKKTFLPRQFFLSHSPIMVSFEEVKDIPNHPDTYLIDVREKQEISETGAIPASINVPLGELKTYLQLSDDKFAEVFKREKPKAVSPIIFTCKSGKRAENAAGIAKQLGFSNVQVYEGSWTEWAEKGGPKMQITNNK